MKKVLILTLSSLLLIGCNEKEISQDGICIYSTDEEAKSCINGKLSYFKARSWGNKQLPLDVISAYCDLNHQVIHNESGVICVFTDKRTTK
ncbi:hypothetical protein [Pasteurella multocida]|uniref:hypothetical protein n=1 Tax=Pasteurella multocida TaxID=747 RepID=UPI001F52F58B|nr:hypothetical protein [Pasteurella multocida]